MLTNYKKAKPELINRLGLHCSYCEQSSAPQDLHVEHIYPKDPHPELERDWHNFLLACSSCNSYKNYHLGSTRQIDLESRYIWPHRENTFLAFSYSSDGRVEIVAHLAAGIRQAANDTLEMIGMMKSPVAAAKYEDGIAYDGMQKRKEMWKIANEFKNDYLASNGTLRTSVVADLASKMGHFSIWMTVFHDRPEVRCELINAFKAARACFSPNSQPIGRGRI